MRAQRTRRSIWIINAGLGLALIALGGWYAVDVHAEVSRIRANRVGAGIPGAREALEQFHRGLGRAGAVLIAPSCAKAEVDEVFHIKDKLTWPPFVGPIQPPPGPKEPGVGQPSVRLADLVRVRMLITGKRPLVVLVPRSGPTRYLLPGEELRVPGWQESLELRRVTQVERSIYHVVFGTRGAGAEEVIEVRTHDAPTADDPVRPDAPPGAPHRTSAVPTTKGLPDLDRVVVTRVSRGRTHVRIPSTLWRALRADQAAAVLEDVKTREVQLPGGTRGVQLAHVGVKAQLVHKVNLKNGDTLLRINGTATPTRGAVAEVLRGLPADTQRVTVTVDRAGQTLHYEIAADASRTRR